MVEVSDEVFYDDLTYSRDGGLWRTNVETRICVVNSIIGNAISTGSMSKAVPASSLKKKSATHAPLPLGLNNCQLRPQEAPEATQKDSPIRFVHTRRLRACVRIFIRCSGGRIVAVGK